MQIIVLDKCIKKLVRSLNCLVGVFQLYFNTFGLVTLILIC